MNNNTFTLVPAKCTQCGANLKVNPEIKTAKCKFCGTSFLVDEGIKNLDIENLNVKNAENITVNKKIKINKKGTLESVLSHYENKKRMEMEERERERKEREAKAERIRKGGFKALILENMNVVVPLLLFIISLSFLMMLSSKDHSEKTSKPNAIEMPLSSSEIIGADLDYVKNELEYAGFKNIKSIPMKDLSLGILKKEGEIEKINVDGSKIFSSGEKFDKNSKIIISYHSFPNSDKSNKSEEQKETISKKSEETSTKKEEKIPIKKIITKENNEFFNKLLNKKSRDFNKFTEENIGNIIEFDACISSMMNTTNSLTGKVNKYHFSLLIDAGDFSDVKKGNVLSVPFKIDEINSTYMAQYDENNTIKQLEEGINIRITAEILKYDSNLDQIKIKPIKMIKR